MKVNELKLLSENIDPIRLMPYENINQLNILWNKGSKAKITVEDIDIEVNSNCIVFLSEYYMNIEADSNSFRLIQFDKSYLNPLDGSYANGEYLMIFYGTHSINAVPKITLKEEEVLNFEQIWRQLLEYNDGVNNPVFAALQRNSLQRFLLLGEHIHMQSSFDIPINFRDLKIIREFQYLVNNNFKELTKVSEYAEILKISPKKISELFSCCYNRKPSEIIADRRNLFAKRQLKHTNELIKNIAYDLNFSDSQTFSHFFKKRNGISPEEFRSLEKKE
jgi:AraC-like DNA-binding protein